MAHLGRLGFYVIQSLFTGTIAKVANLIAIVIGATASRTGSRCEKALAGVALT
jgi:hypothetical protein